MKKKWFVLEISRFLCLCEILRFSNLQCHHRHCYIMKVTLMLISFGSSPPNCSQDSWKLLTLFMSINWPISVLLLNELWFKQYIQKCILSPVPMFIMTDLVNQGMVKNTKTGISWERNITFLQNKKILSLCLRWHILRSYSFAVEVTFKDNIWRQNKILGDASLKSFQEDASMTFLDTPVFSLIKSNS